MAQPRRIVLTGASRGLGRALAEGFLAAGHVVHACARSSPDGSGWKTGHFRTVDVSDDGAVAAWARSVLSAGEPPDLIVNNAAVITPSSPLWEVSAGDFRSLIDINIRGVFHVIRHFVPAMLPRRRGVIVNFSSGWGRSASPEVAPYCASKWAIEGLTRALSQELPRGMAAVALNPGVIDTGMLRSCFDAAASSYPGPSRWAETAVPYILGLGPEHNGESLTVPA